MIRGIVKIGCGYALFKIVVFLLGAFFIYVLIR